MIMQAKDGITAKQAAEILGVSDKSVLAILSGNKTVRRISRATNLSGRGGAGALWHEGDVKRLKVDRDNFARHIPGETFVTGHPSLLKPWNKSGLEGVFNEAR